MTAIICFFVIIVSASITSVLVGFHEAFLYLIKSSQKKEKVKSRLTALCDFIFFVIGILLVFVILNLEKLLKQTVVGNYVAVIVYTMLLGLLSADVLYISPSTEINSSFKAFKKGFTKGNVNHLIPNLYIKTFVNLFYLVILILAQIEGLGLATKMQKESNG